MRNKLSSEIDSRWQKTLNIMQWQMLHARGRHTHSHSYWQAVFACSGGLVVGPFPTLRGELTLQWDVTRYTFNVTDNTQRRRPGRHGGLKRAEGTRQQRETLQQTPVPQPFSSSTALPLCTTHKKTIITNQQITSVWFQHWSVADDQSITLHFD